MCCIKTYTTLQLHSFSELKGMKQHRTPAMAIRFTLCSAACQAVTIWIQKNLPVLERQMARPQGAGILADLTACNALDPNCSKVNLSIFTLLCIHLCFVLLFKSVPDNIRDPLFFFLNFRSFPFRSWYWQRAARRKPRNELVSTYGRLHCIHTAFSGFLSGPLGNRSALPVRTELLPQDHTACCTLT